MPGGCACSGELRREPRRGRSACRHAGAAVCSRCFADVVAPHSPIEQFRDHFLTPPVWQQGGNCRIPARHRRCRPRHAVAPDLRRAAVADDRHRRGHAVADLRHRAGPDRGLRRRRGRHGDHAADGHRAGVPEPAAGHRHRRDPRPRPVQRDDRGRHRHAAQLHAADARRGAVGTGARLRHRDALRRRRARCI